jgi:hypothetical protein
MLVHLFNADKFNLTTPDFPINRPVTAIQSNRTLSLSVPEQGLIVKPWDLPNLSKPFRFHEFDPELKLVDNMTREFTDVLLCGAADVDPGNVHVLQYPS